MKTFFMPLSLKETARMRITTNITPIRKRCRICKRTLEFVRYRPIKVEIGHVEFSKICKECEKTC